MKTGPETPSAEDGPFRFTRSFFQPSAPPLDGADDHGVRLAWGWPGDGDIFPSAGCRPPQRPAACTITLNPRSATLLGVVMNSCTSGPFDNVRIQLIDPSANAIRFDTTNVSGAFQFQGLEPGAAHSLMLSQ